MSSNARQQPLGTRGVLSVDSLGRLLGVLAQDGYQLLGPSIRSGSIAIAEISGLTDLPRGWRDRQEPGRYTLQHRQDLAFFANTVGQHSWKPFFFVPTLEVLATGRENGACSSWRERPKPIKRALIGIRSCDLSALAIQDRVFLGGRFVESDYAARREHTFVIAVNCTSPGGTCFCVSMGTGPKASFGYDIALTELIDESGQRFLAHAANAAAAAYLEASGMQPASDQDRSAAAGLLNRAAHHMGRQLQTSGIRDLLVNNPEHDRWQDVAKRCLGCANCTLVCPTCFCSTVRDQSDLDGSNSRRIRLWDSCFTLDHSYLHGGSVRASLPSRYRQWLTHKLATWIDQFGTSGCVGCGRCITWCPVGIDITQEVAAIRNSLTLVPGQVLPTSESEELPWRP